MSNCKYCEKEIKNGDKVAIIHKDCFNKIADLEAKLAEREEQLKEEIEEKHSVRRALRACNHQNDEFADIIKKLAKEKEELKQHLAEKDKQTEEVKKWWAYQYNREMKNQYQDKISLALEQLQWLKEKVNNAKIHKINMINTHELYEILDNQIKQLKRNDL